MQIPILSGIYCNSASDFRRSYPRNLVPIIQANGISNGYLRPADGIVEFATGVGSDRGGIEWNGTLYRVMGTKLVSVSSTGAVTVLGDVGGSGQVTFDYSFDQLAIASSGKLFYWNGTTLTQVTDPDLGTVVDFVWVDGYFFTTDGEFLITTDINNPTSVNPLKYASSELDPDPVEALIKFKNEVYALNRHSIEVFTNIGGTGFPFQRVDGARIQRGSVGTFTCALYLDTIAFVGGGRNEQNSVYLIANGNTVKIATREIDQILAQYDESTLASALVESRLHDGLQHLYIHLPDKTLVYDGASSQVAQEAVWFILTSSIVGDGQYRARNFIFAYNKWICGDTKTSKLGYVSNELSSQWGDINGWQFETQTIFNENKGMIFHELELVSLTGNVPLGDDPTIWASYSIDGVTWSQEKPYKAGKIGYRSKKINWLQQGFVRDWSVRRFRGTSDSHLSMARLEARIEPLAW